MGCSSTKNKADSPKSKTHYTFLNLTIIDLLIWNVETKESSEPPNKKSSSMSPA